MSPPPTRSPVLKVETRTLEQIPPEERRGQAWHLAPFWFTGNFVLTTLATGFIGPALGLPALSAILAILCGVGLGTLCMALHANQGPRLGLAQMIQSRAQFGVYGAVLPFAAVMLVYLGFNVFNLVLASAAIDQVVPGPQWLWQIILLGVAMVIAIVGHDLLQTVQRWLTYALITLFAVLTFTATTALQIDAAQPQASFTWSAFLGQLSTAAAYQISYAVYVSDYSRYLPANTPARRVIGWTYLGAAASAMWLMSLGALLASALPMHDPISLMRYLGDLLAPGLGSFAVLMTVPALVGIMAVNCYGAMLTGATAISAFRPFRGGSWARVQGISVIGCVILLTVMLLPAGYLQSFQLFLQLMLYLLVPWSAINLTDFYLVRRGRYIVSQLFDAHGIYGRWAWPGLLSYLAGLLAMIPFASLGPLQGYFVVAMDGVNLAFVAGFTVAAGLYLTLMRWHDRRLEAHMWGQLQERQS